MPRRLCPAPVLPALLVCAVVGADDCTVSFPRLANAYFTDETRDLTLSLPAPRRTVSVRVTDYYGACRYASSLGVGGTQAVSLTLPAFGVGYYTLDLKWSSGSHRETFCVLPRPYEDAGDYSIFGLCPGNGSTDEILETAAQMGVRLVRQTVPWPPFEPQRGVWRTDLLEDWYAMAARHGIQMMLVLGYTPSFLAQKPANAFSDVWANNAVFTWHPTEPNEYGLYLDQVTGFARNKTVSWPATGVMPAQGRPSRQSLPWTHSWEMWNEADICFYMGDWNRYMDLLHMSWAAGRQRVPEAPMVYGGSTGNWAAMGMVASGSPKHCFDYVGLHTGGDVEEALRIWYSGSQQIPWCVGAPRETSHTECYAQGRRGSADYTTYQETPGELLRCYLTLKAWREASFFRSGCLGGYIGTDEDYAPGTALLRADTGKLQPTPLYPAFAATRKLLSDATEVGPVNLGDKITAHLFLKHGAPLLAAWSDDGATATISLSRTAVKIDPFGRCTSLGGGASVTVRLTAEPLVILGVSDTRYLPEAFRRRFELLTTTPYGTPQTNSTCFVWYANPMVQDLADLLGPSRFTLLEMAVQQAEKAFATTPSAAPQALVTAQNACMSLSVWLLHTCTADQEVPVKVANNLWRLARMEEWLGEIADDRSGVWNNLALPGATVQAMNRYLDTIRSGLVASHPDAELPVADHLLQRCLWTKWRLNQVQRRGTYTALLHKAQVAYYLNALEKPVVLRVVPLVDFSTGQSFRKARMLEPGRTHTLNVWAYNYLGHETSGTLQLKLPAGWSPATARVPFRAGAGQPSAMTAVPVTLPDEPEPWVQAATFTMDGYLNVSLPASLADRPLLAVDGTLDSGPSLETMSYFVNVGQWLDGAAVSSASATRLTSAQVAANAALQLPPAVKAVQTRSLVRQMQSLSRGLRTARAAE